MKYDPWGPPMFGQCARCGGSLCNGHRCTQDLVEFTPEQIEAIRESVERVMIPHDEVIVDLLPPAEWLRNVVDPRIVDIAVSPPLSVLEVKAAPYMRPKNAPPQWFVDLYSEFVSKYFPNIDFDASG